MENHVKQKQDNIVGLAGTIAGEIEKQPDIYGAGRFAQALHGDRAHQREK